MTIKDKIEQLQNLKCHCSDMAKGEAPSNEWMKDIEALDFAIATLEQESKKGHWIFHEKSVSTGFKDLRECSCCRCYFRWEMPRNSFCPNCGTRMSEVEND